MEGHLLMSRKELARKSILELVKGKRITLVQASKGMHLSYRQTLRVYARFVEQGDEGLVHRNRGRPSNRAYPSAFRNKVLARYRARYKEVDCGPTLAAEKIAKEGLAVDHETLRRWMLTEGEWEKHRKGRSHRSRRERRARFGELVQMDGSHHNWFGPDKDKACLMNMVDDATGATMGLMDHQETTQAAMNLLRCWLERYGIPLALYTDKKNVYITERAPTLEEQLADEQPMTAFGKACHKLGIEIISAHSPQAKGRVERSNGVYQDRLVKELALQRIATIPTANKLLHNGFTDELNEKFAVAPLEKEDSHRPIPKGLNLDDVFCFEAHRVLQNDWCIRHKNRYFQVFKENKPLPKPKDKILVRTHLDGTIDLLHREKSLVGLWLTPKAYQKQTQQAPMAQPTKTERPKTPKQSPWRQGCTLMAADSAKEST